MTERLNTHLIHSASDPWLQKGYSALSSYFGVRGEMEDLDVIKERFKWDPCMPNGDYSLFYEMVVFSCENNNILAVCDYSVILSHLALKQNQAVVVHLSHIWINPKNPGLNIVNYHLPNLAAQAALSVLNKAKLPLESDIMLVGEVEPYEEGNIEKIRRLKRFLYANWRIVDPKAISYYQPDFRSPDVIDSSGSSMPLLLLLLLKRINRESETEITATEIRHIVNCLYQMYSFGIRTQDMSVVYETINNYPSENTSIPLFNKLAQLSEYR